MPKIDGRLLKRQRKEVGLTQEELAEKLRISAKSIYRYEKGGKISEDILNDLETFFSMSLRLVAQDRVTYQYPFEERMHLCRSSNNVELGKMYRLVVYIPMREHSLECALLNYIAFAHLDEGDFGFDIPSEKLKRNDWLTVGQEMDAAVERLFKQIGCSPDIATPPVGMFFINHEEDVWLLSKDGGIAFVKKDVLISFCEKRRNFLRWDMLSVIGTFVDELEKDYVKTLKFARLEGERRYLEWRDESN